MLNIKNLSKKYGNSTVLDNINFSVQPGEIAVFLGHSGVGKSTLLRVLSGLEKADSGEIINDGEKINKEVNDKKHMIGFVFQNFSLFQHLSVHDNIALVLKKILNYSDHDANKKTTALLEQFQLLKHATLPISSLSGGQKQRLAIARALSIDPAILCMDEPTSALDPLLTNYVAQQVQDLACAGYKILITSHDMSFVKNLNCTIYLMKNGAIIEQAPSSLFFENPEKFQAINSFMKG